MRPKGMVKNSLITCLSRLPSPKNPIPKKVLILSTTGLGDTLWATPALAALKKAGAHISVVTSPVGKELLAVSPDIDTLYPFDLTLAPKLRKERFDAILLFHISQRLAMALTAYIGAPHRIGTAGLHKGLDHLLTNALPQEYCHEIDRRLAIANAYMPITSDGRLRLHLTPEDEAPFSEKPIICLHPGAKDPYKQWRPDHFVAVGTHLAKRGQIVVTGSRDEHALAEGIASRIPGAINIAGKQSLRRFAGIIKQSALFITGDTGPMHLAYAAGTPTVALFAPTDPALCGPHKATNALVIAKPKTCTPCLGKPCREPFCLDQIAPRAVIERAETLLESA